MTKLEEFIDLEQRVGTVEAMRLTGCSYSGLAWRIDNDPDFPQPTKISAKLSWSLREILDYVEVRKQKTPVEREAFRAERRREIKRRQGGV